MKKTVVFLAALIWACVQLASAPYCQAELVEMSDQQLNEVTGQSGSFIYSNSLPATADFDGAGFASPRVGSQAEMLQQWMYAFEEFNYISGTMNTDHPVNHIQVWVRNSSTESRSAHGNSAMGAFEILNLTSMTFTPFF
ncbi:MAG: hypothetical protein ACQERN_05220 [Thermodesulfobacteriota bacterium]